MKEQLDFVIITGMSGAGKSETVKIFEDVGFFCVDNLPPALISKFAELCRQSKGEINQVALVVDIRGGDFFDNLFAELAKLENIITNYRILFLEAETETLINRFKKTRRRHPLAQQGRILEAINLERERLERIRGKADKIIDTTNLTPKELKKRIQEDFIEKKNEKQLNLSVLSFGFKYGVPLDSDLMFDVRFLPNPHYVDSLRPLTGEDKRVQDYVLKWPITQKFKYKLFDMIKFLIPQYIKEGKSHLMIAVGCTGGKHRSVTLAEKLYQELKNEYNVLIEHRDSNK
ncbi:RNase adapter RapZ [Natroniella acetigena]|uniref:RNase adapter RapZ n=1 Tax=Natroniella acetigena TaxID=52004 RepID=UPI00200AC704|nr:RNase adapter RapZ [Natroniella acetigena]MCK8828045.1 RNase adapter RapZ [Natroniella acetigena]